MINSTEIQLYLELIADTLSQRRAEHSRCVADSAAELAERFGYDRDIAYLAGLFHDITKETAPARQLELIRENCVELSSVEKTEPKLWHAPSGAAFVKENLRVWDDDFYNAIRFHTTGRAGMSLLEKIIYIADYISSDREYDGVEEMRELAGESLEKAMMYALQFCISKQATTQKFIEPHSVECYNELVAALKKTK